MALSKIKSSSMADTAIHGRRNLIINGAMQVSQRIGDSSASSNNYSATPDRIRQEAYGGASASFQRVTDAPTGFKHSLKVTCAGTSTASSGNTLRLMTGLEGQNIAHLGYGTSEAKTTTLSFYVKGSETGTYSVAFNNIRPSGGLQNVTRAYIKTYTIDVANTWEYKTLTFPGSTDGTWGSSNSDGITIVFDLGSGSDHQGATNQWLTTPDNMASGQVTLGDSNGGTWQITGIQLEVGEQATPFEHRSFGEELALCQRYFQKSIQSGTTSYPSSDGYARGMYLFPVQMRADPTGTFTDAGTGGSSISNSTNQDGYFNTYGSLSGLSAGQFSWTMDAEL